LNAERPTASAISVTGCEVSNTPFFVQRRERSRSLRKAATSAASTTTARSCWTAQILHRRGCPSETAAASMRLRFSAESIGIVRLRCVIKYLKSSVLNGRKRYSTRCRFSASISGLSNAVTQTIIGTHLAQHRSATRKALKPGNCMSNRMTSGTKHESICSAACSDAADLTSASHAIVASSLMSVSRARSSCSTTSIFRCIP
jgi:hypothetical protein